jgi:hypothetical protein
MARETARVGHVLHTEYRRINLQNVMEETKNLTQLPQTWLHQCRWNYKALFNSTKEDRRRGRIT